jgi:glycosyltransferase involved in cell wall biosynthesis
MGSLVTGIREIAFHVARAAYHRLKGSLGPVIRRYPRLHKLVQDTKEPLKQFLRPSVELDQSNSSRETLPQWLIDEWRTIHDIDPRVFPERWPPISFYLYDFPESLVGKYYEELCAVYPKNASHVFLLPWLLTGGADLVALNYVHALQEKGFSRNVVVITTLDVDSPWATRLAEGVVFIEFGRKYGHLSPDDQQALLARLFVQMSPRVIHNINSDLGYRVFLKYGRALKSASSKLFVSSFCIDHTQYGNMAGYPVWYLPKCYNLLDGLFSDNANYLNLLCEMFAYERDIMRVHYQPMKMPKSLPIRQPRLTDRKLNILWAGRLDMQKRPDLLLAIARECAGMDMHFHVYGSAVMNQARTTVSQFEKLDNLTYHGVFDGMCSLPTQMYDLFLYTSEWDGLPNVLLEAFSVGLPVVASNVGGIPELIRNEETGFLIDPFDNVDGFVECLARLCVNQEILQTVRENAFELLKERHSFSRFVECVAATPHYILPPEASRPVFRALRPRRARHA